MTADDGVGLADLVHGLVGQHKNERGSLLPILHGIQHAFGYIPPEAIPIIASGLNLSRADVYGVVTFYRDFRDEPATRTVRVCRAEACQSAGAEALAEHARQKLATSFGGTSPAGTGPAGTVHLDEVFCLGNCALGPSVEADGMVYGRVGPAELDSIIAADERGAPATTGGGEPKGRAAAWTDERGSAATDRGGKAAGQSAPEAPSNTVTIYVPGDTAARSVGADKVAALLAGHLGQDVTIVRNGSRGMLWLEPLVEVVTDQGRVAYGPVTPADVPELVAAGLTSGAEHRLRLGLTDEIEWLANQTRLTFARVGVVDPLSADDYLAHGGMEGLRKALTMTSEQVVQEVITSGLRGRGGAGFPAGIKWQTTLRTPGGPKFICCNADEGDSGTFADRMLMEGDPFCLIEGMLIAAWATGATEGYIYLRSEYPAAAATLTAAIAAARERGWLGEHILGSTLCFDIQLRIGGGAYICGEETAMLDSLEGKRGMVRPKPPIPAIAGLFAGPTLVNNVITLATAPAILTGGGAAHAELGTGRSRGTGVFQLGGNVAQGGIVEVPFGVTLGELVVGYGAGTRSGRPVRAVQVGGPLGAYHPVSQLDLPLDYEAFAAASAMVGHGGIVVFDDTVDLARQARFAMEFCAKESCGKCTPCRIGSIRGAEVIDKIIADVDRDSNLVLLHDLCEVMTDGSLCAMGGLTPVPVRSALNHFPEDFRRPATEPPPPVRVGHADRHPAPSLPAEVRI